MSNLFVTGTRGGPPPDIKTKPMAVAIDDYDAENHREVSFKKEEKIYVTFWSSQTSWWKGWVGGQIGYFPKESVRPLFDTEQHEMEKNKTVRGLEGQDKKRRQLILSIASTEEQYVKDIQIIQDFMREMQPLLSPSDMQEIFGNIEEIISESKASLALFLRKAKTEEPVGDVFLRMANLFEQEVIPWASNLAAVICYLEKLSSSNSDFQAVFDSCSEKVSGLGVYEWLGKPIRRAMECFSIVKMLLMKTPQENADHKDLTEALEILQRVKETLNKPFEDLENLLKVVQLQSALQGQESLVSLNRKFIKEVNLQEVLRGGKKTSERKAVLLSDCLVVVKMKRTGFGQGTVFPLTRVQIAPVSDSGSALKNVFELTLNIGGGKKERRRFSMATAGERDAFLSAVQQQFGVQANSSTGSISLGDYPRKGIFQKLRSNRSLSIGGDDNNPPSTLLSRSSSSNVVVSPSTPSKSPRSEAAQASAKEMAAKRAALLGMDTPSERQSNVRESSRTDISRSPRSGSDEVRRNPRPTVGSDHTDFTRDSSYDTATTQLARASSAVYCAACQEPISGNALNSKGKFYHNTCYKCTECGKSLVGVPFAEKKGVPYCKECAIEKFAEPCAGCQKMITGQFLSAFGEKYHPQCFLCANGCGTNVSRGYAKRNGKAYCRACCKLLEKD